MVAIVEFPQSTINAFVIKEAIWHVIIFSVYVPDGLANPVGRHRDTPFFIFDHVIDTSRASEAFRLKCIACKSAGTCNGVTTSHEDRIGRMPKMIHAGVLSGLMSTKKRIRRSG